MPNRGDAASSRFGERHQIAVVAIDPHRPQFSDRDALEHGVGQTREESYELFGPADLGLLHAAAQRLGT